MGPSSPDDSEIPQVESSSAEQRDNAKPLDSDASEAKTGEAPARVEDGVLDIRSDLRPERATGDAEAPLVFVSYRVDPDQPVAVALQKLIEGSLDPPLRAFVAGYGGLRPSTIGFKPQLQIAVQRAKVVVGIITQASKEREWILYEAGAAFGRSQLYCPLLVDTTPADLASSIADYQATRATNKDEMLRLLSEIAETCSAQVRKVAFNKRWQAFERAVEQHIRPPKQSEVDEDASPEWRAIQLSRQGRKDDALQILDEHDRSAVSLDAKVSAITARFLVEEVDDFERLERMENLDAALKETATWLYWMANYEPRPVVALRHLEKFFQVAPANAHLRPFAMVDVARCEIRAGREQRAREQLLRALRDNNRRLRSGAAEAWTELLHNDPSIYRLLVLIVGLEAFETPELLRRATEIALDENWPSLLVWFARQYDKREDSAYSAHTLGRAYATLGLNSLAYRAYARAAEGGISVAKSNMASLATQSALPAVGLALLDAHVGRIAAADPAAPYSLRAALETAVHAEKKRADKLADAGKRLFDLLGALSEEAPVDAEGKVAPRYQCESERFTTTTTSTDSFDLSSDAGGPTASFKRVGAGSKFWISDKEIVRVASTGALIGVACDLRTDDPGSSPVEYIPLVP